MQEYTLVSLISLPFSKLATKHVTNVWLFVTWFSSFCTLQQKLQCVCVPRIHNFFFLLFPKSNCKTVLSFWLLREKVLRLDMEWMYEIVWDKNGSILTCDLGSFFTLSLKSIILSLLIFVVLMNSLFPLLIYPCIIRPKILKLIDVT